MNCVLTIIAGECSNRSLQIGEGDHTIGRESDNGVQIMSSSVSRRHARLSNTGGACRLIDLGSSNGTLVNGKRVTSYVLRHGDEIMMGDVIMRFEQLPDAGTDARHITTGKEYSSRSQQVTVTMRREDLCAEDDEGQISGPLLKPKISGRKPETTDAGSSAIEPSSQTQPIEAGSILKLKRKTTQE